MSLTYTPINELPFAPNFEGNDYLLIWDISQPANQARRLTFTALASYLAYTNRQLDWDDIANKPDSFPPAVHTHIPTDILELVDSLANLPNGVIIGGVAHFFQSSPPTTRIGGGALQFGDRLIKSNGQDYFWSGSEWLTCQAGGIAGRYTFLGNENFLIESSTLIGYEELSSLKIEKLIVRYQRLTSGNDDASNYWNIWTLFRGSRNQLGAGFANLDFCFALNGSAFPLPSTSPQKIIIPINQIANYCDIAAISCSCSKTSNPSSVLQASFNLIIRGVHPS